MPLFHLTKPPYTDLVALPDPNRAKIESPFVEIDKLYAFTKLAANAAKAELEEASQLQ